MPAKFDAEYHNLLNLANGYEMCITENHKVKIFASKNEDTSFVLSDGAGTCEQAEGTAGEWLQQQESRNTNSQGIVLSNYFQNLDGSRKHTWDVL